MSRSYKHFPLFRDVLGSTSMKYAKKQANKRVRNYIKQHLDEVQNNSWYKHIYNTWDIYEYKSYQSKQDAIQEYENDLKEIENGISPWKKRYITTLEQALIDWYLSYKRK